MKLLHFALYSLVDKVASVNVVCTIDVFDRVLVLFPPCKYGAFKERGNGVLNEVRVAHFSATTLPFPASENADIR
jgi:hypothetical protein